VLSAPSATRVIGHAIAPAGDFDVYELDVTVDAYVRAETFAATAASEGCQNPNGTPADTVLGLFASDGVTLLAVDDNTGVDACSRLDTVDTLFALSPGTYFLLVEESGNNAAIPAYELVVDSVAAFACGNGVV